MKMNTSGVSRCLLSCALGVLLAPALLAQGPVPQQEGWPVTLPDVDYFYPPTVADIDGDGQAEVIASGSGSEALLYIFRGDGTLYPGWPPAPTELGTWYKPRLGDIDGDGEVDVLTYCNSLICAFDLNGGTKPGFPIDVPGSTVTIPLEDFILADLDGDGDYEIVAGTYIMPSPPDPEDPPMLWIYAYQGDGTIVEGWPVTVNFSGVTSFQNLGATIAADLDLDGADELITSMVNHSILPGVEWEISPVVVFNGDGSVRDGWPAYPPPPQIIMSRKLAVDLDHDGLSEIVSVSMGAVGILREDGSPFLPTPSPTAGWVLSEAAAGDVDGDGEIEIVAGASLELRVHDSSGETIATTPPGFPYYGFMVVSMADFDGDGDLEIAAVSVNMYDPPVGSPGSEHLHLFDHNLEELPGWPVNIPRMVGVGDDSLCIADLDGDGDLEIIVTQDDSLLAFDVPNPGPGATHVAWGQRGHDPTDSFFAHRGSISYFLRGDANSDGTLDVGDPVALLRYLFLNDEVSCPPALDVDDDGGTDVGDAIYLLTYLFLAGSPPAFPNPDCRGQIDAEPPLCGNDNCQ